jgi:hypothetical protein
MKPFPTTRRPWRKLTRFSPASLRLRSLEGFTPRDRRRPARGSMPAKDCLHPVDDVVVEARPETVGPMVPDVIRAKRVEAGATGVQDWGSTPHTSTFSRAGKRREEPVASPPALALSMRPDRFLRDSSPSGHSLQRPRGFRLVAAGAILFLNHDLPI